MPRIERSAAIGWEGNLARGAGEISADTGAFAGLPYSNATRIGNPEGKTSPEELLAAAHGGCFATSLAGELTRAGSPPERLDVRVVIRMDELEGEGHQIVASTVAAHGRVPGLDRRIWEQAVQAADEGCPFSRLLKKAGADVVVSAELEEG